jgi:drug/metabolite transporter (DMT)-like permease
MSQPSQSFHSRSCAIPAAPDRRVVWLGLLAALAAALTGSGWQIASRYGVTTTLGPLELALLRYGLPALVLLPLLVRTGLRPRGLAPGHLALMVMGGGLPFGLVVLVGAQWAPASHMGMFMAGGVPLFTALAAWRLEGESVAHRRLAGLLLVVAGMAVFGAGNWQDAARAWPGDLLFLLAAALWALYTQAFRRSGLTPWVGAAVVNAWSAMLLLPLLAVFGAPRLLSAPWRDLAWQAAGQGVMAGLLGLVFYMAAIARLGAARASLSAALVPLMTALGAAMLLDEPLGGATLAAVMLAGAGVAWAAGAAPPAGPAGLSRPCADACPDSSCCGSRCRAPG